jgi:ribosomal protein L7Ae-like RNA K-turn-binding protein
MGDKKKPMCVKYGLNHITQLVESGKAQLVVIAHDVDPIELVIWLPALCKKQGIPYCIVKVWTWPAIMAWPAIQRCQRMSLSL